MAKKQIVPPLDVVCPACGAKVGEGCRGIYVRTWPGLIHGRRERASIEAAEAAR